MIRDVNIDPTYSQSARKIVVLPTNEGASVAGVKVSGVITPFAGVLMSAVFRCHTLTDADDSVRVDLLKDGTSILAAAVDPVAADTTTTLAITGSTVTADGSLYELKITTGAGDAIRGSLVLEFRPKLGAVELLTSPLSNS